METKEEYIKRLEKARKKVENIKNFYRHLTVYLIINIILVFLIYRGLGFFGEEAIQDSGFNDWFVLNVFGTPILWGIGLVVHALYVFRFQSKPLKGFKPRFIKDWEARQISKYIEENNE
ncbi:2TM domain-containing protein [Maribacter halichondriae]|uniref:2TM domain-containing protein n=1 Tax=Maribacter halichondriae TaxID=2980554 RepID=UPI002358D680|nr:2TM domain-containing protein [Maribacter sp. Hal144]